jgi:hypothetical protein
MGERVKEGGELLLLSLCAEGASRDDEVGARVGDSSSFGTVLSRSKRGVWEWVWVSLRCEECLECCTMAKSERLPLLSRR